MESFERTIELERGVIDLETGVFPAVLATEGEASDGHIISVKGIDVPDHMPLLFGHVSDVQVPALGSIVGHSKGKKDGVAVLRTEQRVNMEGDDPLADIRRGIAQLMHAGDLRAMSIRWNGDKVTPRHELPENHKHFKSANDNFGAGMFGGPGLFFETSRALEGSVVAVGADPSALMGRSEAAKSSAERAFFLALARQIEGDQAGMGEIATALEVFRASCDALEGLGVGQEELANLIDLPSDDVREIHIQDVTYIVPKRLHEAIYAEPLELYREAHRLHATPECVDCTAEEVGTRESIPVEVAEEVAPKRDTVSNTPAAQFVESFSQALGPAIGGVLERATGRKARSHG